MICLIEEFLKKNAVICRIKNNTSIDDGIETKVTSNPGVSMFEIINDNMLDIIA